MCRGAAETWEKLVIFGKELLRETAEALTQPQLNELMRLDKINFHLHMNIIHLTENKNMRKCYCNILQAHFPQKD